jgi:hypothetical protein
MAEFNLIYVPTDETSSSVQTYGYVFTAGAPFDLGDDFRVYEKLKQNPEFSVNGATKLRKAEALPAPRFSDDPAVDESNEGKDAPTRAAVQKRAVLSLKSAPPVENV